LLYNYAGLDYYIIVIIINRASLVRITQITLWIGKHDKAALARHARYLSPPPVAAASTSRRDPQYVIESAANVHSCVPKKPGAEKNNRYFDLKHLKIYAHLNIFYKF
jgi:hypothetical protein